MILWYFFFISIFYEKNPQSIRCLSVLDREGMAITLPSEFALAMAIEVTDGPKTRLSKLKSVNTSDLIIDVFTGLDITCSRRELKPGTKACPGSRTARWAESKKKKKKSRPTDPPSEKWLVDNQTIYFFWPKMMLFLWCQHLCRRNIDTISFQFVSIYEQSWKCKVLNIITY